MPHAEKSSANAHTERALREAIALALRAPSSHNSQPWRLVLREGELELHADATRRLEVVDPQGRELLISCGAALCSLRVALEHVGFDVAITYDGCVDARLARVVFTPRALDQRERDFSHALSERQTQRAAFSSATLPEETAEQLRVAAESEQARLHFFADDAMRAQLAALVAEGCKAQWRDPRFRRELASWMRPNNSQRGDGLLGYTLGLGSLLSRLAPWVVRHVDTGASQARKDEKLALDAPLLAVLATEADSRCDWLSAGQALQHLLLTAATLGVSAGFLNQPLQLPALRPRVSRLLDRPGYAQLIMRFGRAQPTRPSPRRPLSEVLFDV